MRTSLENTICIVTNRKYDKVLGIKWSTRCKDTDTGPFLGPEQPFQKKNRYLIKSEKITESKKSNSESAFSP